MVGALAYAVYHVRQRRSKNPATLPRYDFSVNEFRDVDPTITSQSHNGTFWWDFFSDFEQACFFLLLELMISDKCMIPLALFCTHNDYDNKNLIFVPKIDLYLEI